MITTINNKLIRSFRPCYDPSKYIDETENLPIKQGIKKYRGIVPAKDILWLLCRNEFLSDRDLRLFAVWCAREALKLVDNPDQRSVAACDVAERYANGEATKEDLAAAATAAAAAWAAAAAAATAASAAWAADATAASAAEAAAAWAADAAAWAADASAADAWAAAAAATAAAAAEAAADAEAAANADAEAAAAWEKQLDKLITYF